MSLRIGAVSYLNTKPLIYGLWDRLPDAELILDLPSRLADRLAASELDIALIPSVEYFRGTGLHVVSDACIACKGPVRSVQLLFRKPPAQVRSLALDEGSRTSAALARVLLAKRFEVRPSLVPLPLGESFRDVETDAVLVIGDRAMKIAAGDFVEAWDLGDEWVKATSLPFVFAMWVTRLNEIDQGVVDALQQCRDIGMTNIAAIAENEAPRHSLSSQDCIRYFTDQLHFHLSQQEIEGLQTFRQLAADENLIPDSSQLLSLQPS